MLREKLCFGNWKLNKTPDEAASFLSEFKSLVSETDMAHFSIFPTSLIAGAFKGEGVNWGPQNIHNQSSGAFTGETSAFISKNMGAAYALIAHSERRHIFGESGELLNDKVQCSIREGLTPVFCIGESEKEREDSKTFDVLKEQLSSGLKEVDLSKVIVAYEPVWAIGTGKAATPFMVKEVHDFLRKELSVKDVPLLYGGSVKPANAEELYKIENVNGFLIGGASLKPESFVEVYNKMKGL